MFPGTHFTNILELHTNKAADSPGSHDLALIQSRTGWWFLWVHVTAVWTSQGALGLSGGRSLSFFLKS